MIGRSAESALLAGALERAASGIGAVVLIEGEAGIGKTRLVQEAVAAADDQGFAVRVGAADEVERRRPFGVLADALGLDGTATDHALDPGRAAVAAMLHQDPGADGSMSAAGGLEFRIVEAVADLVERWCARDRVLLVLEDLHWADPATRSCLARLGRVAAQLSLLLVVTARPLPRSPELAATLNGLVDRGALRLVLAPLAATDLPALTEAVVGAPPGPNLREQLARAGGNPLLVLELLAVLDQHGMIAESGGRAEIADVAAPAVPSLTFLHRMSFLPPETLELLGMASILGSTFAVTDLTLLSGRSAADLARPLRDALQAGVLAERADRLAFRHELIRDALYTDLPEALRVALHRDLALALAGAGQSPGRVAEHLLRGARPGDAQAVEWLCRAAESAGARAPSIAVDLLDRALELADPADPARGRIAADRAMALMFAGRAEEGEAACREVLARRQVPERESELRWILLRTMLIRGRATEALEHVDEALRMRTAAPPERAHFLAAASFARLVLGELDRAVDLAEQAIAVAEPTEDALAISESLHAFAQVRSFQGRLAESAELAVRALHELGSDPVLRGPQTATATAGLMLVATDRAEEGRAVLLRGRQLNESLGAGSGLALHHAVLADALFIVGEWDDAASEIEASEHLTGDGRPAWPVMSLGIMALMAVHRDDPAGAQGHLAAAQAALADGAAPMRAHRMLLAGALLAEAGGQRDRALAMLTGGWDRLAAAGVGAAFPELGPELVRRLMPAGNGALAHAVATAVGECADHNPGVPNIIGAALLCRGLVVGDPDLLVGAVAAYRGSTAPLARALACEDAAAACARTDRAAQARELLDEASGLYEGLAAQRGVVRTAAALRALGVRRGTRARRAKATTGWEALTATERKVVALVAERLSNPEIAERMFLSRRTVETHVSHALAKVGFRSRLELAAEAVRRRSGAGQPLAGEGG